MSQMQMQNAGNRQPLNCIDRYNKQFKWDQSSTKELILVWEEFYGALKGTKINGTIYCAMADIITENLDLDIPIHKSKIQDKIHNLRKKFRSEKMKVDCTGGILSEWWAYDLVKKVVGEEPINRDLYEPSPDTELNEITNGGQEAKFNVDLMNIETLAASVDCLLDPVVDNMSGQVSESEDDEQDGTPRLQKRLHSDMIQGGGNVQSGSGDQCSKKGRYATGRRPRIRAPPSVASNMLRECIRQNREDAMFKRQARNDLLQFFKDFHAMAHEQKELAREQTIYYRKLNNPQE